MLDQVKNLVCRVTGVQNSSSDIEIALIIMITQLQNFSTTSCSRSFSLHCRTLMMGELEASSGLRSSYLSLREIVRNRPGCGLSYEK